MTTLSHKISRSGDETATESHIQNMTNGSHKVSHVLDNCSTSGTENADTECLASNMTKIVTNGSHPLEPTQLHHPVDSPAQNMTKGSHVFKSLPVNDYSEKMTNMTTFSSDENTSECRSSNMTKIVTNGSHPSEPMQLRHPIDLPNENMTKGSHESESSPVNDYSKNVTNMTTFSSDENTSGLVLVCSN